MITCPECGAELAAGTRFCPECGARQPERTPSREVRKVVTVLFADVTGSTALGEQLDPEALRALMNRYFARMRAIIEAHGGTVEKFIGDAVMAVFGIPVVHEDDALRAVRAAAEIRDALGTMNTELEAERGIAIRFRTGVTTGEVVAGDPASGTTLVTGDTVNTAARLEQAAPPGEILLGRLTYSLVRDAVDAEPVEPIAAKGKAEPVEAFRLISVRAGAEGRARHLDAPMVGRDRELASLTDAWRRAVDERTPHLVTLVAPAGVGKSRLVREFIERVRADGGRALVGRCLSYGEGITYWPVRELVHQAAGITEADDREAAVERIGAVAPDPQIAGLIAAAVGLSTGVASQDELFWAIRRFLEQLGDEQPTLVVLEDLHWAEDTLLDLVDYVIDLAAGVPLLLLATARPDLTERRPGFLALRDAATVQRLDALDGSAAEALLDALPGGSAIPQPLRRRILEAAEGNPLYVEELLGLLRDEGHLDTDDEGGWSAAPDIEAVAVPASIQALLAARLEALPGDERSVAQRASVIGRSFELAALTELDHAPTGMLARHLLSLVRKELLRPDRAELLAGDAFRFRHILIRDAAYEALPKAERAALHERFADWLDRVAGDRLIELEEIVGYHLAQACRFRTELGETGDAVEHLAERAAGRLTAAGLRAEHRDDHPTAIALLQVAAELPGRPTADADSTRLWIASALENSGRYESALAIATEVRERAATSRDVVNEARAAVIALEVRSDLGRPTSGAAEWWSLAEDARGVVDRSRDDLARGRLLRLVGHAQWIEGRLDEAHDARMRSLALLRAAEDLRGIREIEAHLLVEQVYGATPLDEVLPEIERLLDSPPSSREWRAFILSHRGLVRAMLGDVDGGRVDATTALQLYVELGREFADAGLWELACIERLAGRYEDEASALQEQRATMPARGERIAAAHALALAKLGRREDADAALAGSDGDASPRTVRLRTLATARLAALEGRDADALRLADEVEQAVVPDVEFAVARAEALLEAGVIATLTGDPAAARRRAQLALDAAKQKQNWALAGKAEALLAGDLGAL